MSEETRGAEADNAGRQDLEEEAVEEGMGGHRPLLQPLPGPTVAIGEADLAIVDVEKARVRDGHLMRGAADRVDDLGGARQGCGGLPHPRGGVELVEEVRTALRGSQGRGGVAAGARCGRGGRPQGLEELAPQDQPSGFHGEEKRGMGGPPAAPGIRPGASWDQAVDRAVGVEELSPRLEDHDAAQWASEVVSPALEPGRTGGRKHEAQAPPFMAPAQRVEAMR